MENQEHLDSTLVVTEKLEMLWKNEDFQFLKALIDNKINLIRDDIEYSGFSMNEVQMRSNAMMVGFLRNFFYDLFPLWREEAKIIKQDSQSMSEDSPLV